MNIVNKIEELAKKYNVSKYNLYEDYANIYTKIINNSNKNKVYPNISTRKYVLRCMQKYYERTTGE